MRKRFVSAFLALSNALVLEFKQGAEEVLDQPPGAGFNFYRRSHAGTERNGLAVDHDGAALHAGLGGINQPELFVGHGIA